MDKLKTIYEPIPIELTEKIKLIEQFKTLRIGEELWDIGESYLKKEKLWPGHFNFNFKSGLEYGLILMNFFGQYCKIGYNKKSPWKDDMRFSYVLMAGDNTIKNEFIMLEREMFVTSQNRMNIEAIKEGLHKNIYTILVQNEKKDKLKESQIL
ncbi:Uncharacterised protein [uncultured archaeon]|nr:Uncharacterised protein [uncultured archaeon]